LKIIPILNEYYKNYKDKGLDIISHTPGWWSESVDQFVEQQEIKYPVIMDVIEDVDQRLTGIYDGKSTTYPGNVVGVIVGMILTLPISSAALCVMLGLNGLAAGAATAGCAAQMIGFAVTSFKSNRVSGLLSQGIGTSMLQVPNIFRRPQIWIAPTVASAVCGAMSSAVLKIEATKVGAGMGTSGLVGPIDTYTVMAPQWGAVKTLICIAFIYFILPAAVSLLVHFALVKADIVKDEYLQLNNI
jgi:uncharacterized membrane protein